VVKSFIRVKENFSGKDNKAGCGFHTTPTCPDARAVGEKKNDRSGSN